jgi:uncharacterized protein YcgI (DUF1989 family)
MLRANRSDPGETLSTGVTLDCNGSVRIKEGEHLFSNHYHEMLTIVQDKVGMHDLLYPACSPYMYQHQYRISKDHPSCQVNLASVVAGYGIADSEIPNPFNIFMHTILSPDGSISIERPLSRPGDFIELRAEMDLILAVSACSVEESKCNGYRCTSIEIQFIVH